MKRVKMEEAVGQVLCHDLTRIVRGVSKGPAFKKGHVVTAQDIPLLLSMGKDYLYIWENDASMLHENDAADLLRGLCQGAHMSASAPSEGKIELRADCDGLLLVDVDRLRAVNQLGDLMIATRLSGFPAKKAMSCAAPG